MSSQRKKTNNKSLEKKLTVQSIWMQVLEKGSIIVGILSSTLLVALFFHEQISNSSYFWSGYWADYYEQNIPFLKTTIEAIRSGNLPFWNAYSLSGSPLMADPITGIFYPLYYPFYLISPVDSDYFSIYKWLIIFHFWIFHFGFYQLSRTWNISSLSSVFVATCLTFSCIFVCRWQFIPVLFTLAWYPFVLIFYEKIFQGRRLKDALIGGLLLSTAFFAGHTQYFFYLLLILFFYSLTSIAFLAKSMNRSEVKKILILAALFTLPLVMAGVIGLVQILQTLEYLPYSSREEITFSFAANPSMTFQHLQSLVHPKIFGWYQGRVVDYPYKLGYSYQYWETAFYFGITAFILGFGGLLCTFKKRITLFLIILGIFGFLHGLGENGFLFKILFNIPPFNLFRIPTRTMLYPVMAFAFGAGFGMDYLVNKPRHWKSVAALGVGGAIILFLLLSHDDLSLKESLSLNKTELVVLGQYFAKAWIVFGLSLFLIILLFLSRNSILIAFLILVLVLDLFEVNKSYKNQDTDPRTEYSVPENIKNIISKDPRKEYFRVGPESNSYRYLKRNQGALIPAYSFDGFCTMVLQNENPQNWPIRDMMSTKYLFTAEKVGNGLKYSLKENKAAWPYANFANATMKEASSNIGRGQVYIGKDLSFGPSTGSWQITEYNAASRTYLVETSEEAIFRISEWYMPFWKAYIDAKPVDLLKANYFQQAVVIPKGKHDLVIKWESKGFNIGKYISILAVILALIGIAYYHFSWQRKKINLPSNSLGNK